MLKFKIQELPGVRETRSVSDKALIICDRFSYRVVDALKERVIIKCNQLACMAMLGEEIIYNTRRDQHHSYRLNLLNHQKPERLPRINFSTTGGGAFFGHQLIQCFYDRGTQRIVSVDTADPKGQRITHDFPEGASPRWLAKNGDEFYIHLDNSPIIQAYSSQLELRWEWNFQPSSRFDYSVCDFSGSHGRLAFLEKGSQYYFGCSGYDKNSDITQLVAIDLTAATVVWTLDVPGIPLFRYFAGPYVWIKWGDEYWQVAQKDGTVIKKYQLNYPTEEHFIYCYQDYILIGRSIGVLEVYDPAFNLLTSIQLPAPHRPLGYYEFNGKLYIKLTNDKGALFGPTFGRIEVSMTEKAELEIEPISRPEIKVTRHEMPSQEAIYQIEILANNLEQWIRYSKIALNELACEYGRCNGIPREHIDKKHRGTIKVLYPASLLGDASPKILKEVQGYFSAYTSIKNWCPGAPGRSNYRVEFVAVGSENV